MRRTTDSACTGDAAAQKQVSSWTVGPGIGDQQIGNTWTAADKLVSLSTNGDLNIFDKRESTGRPAQIVHVRPRPQTSSFYSHTCLLSYVKVAQVVIYLQQGPTKPVTSSTVIPSSSTFYAGSTDGKIVCGSVDTGVLENVIGDSHTNLVSGLTGAEGGLAWSVGYDDKIREITANGFAWVHVPMGVCSIFNTNFKQASLRVN